MRVRATVVAAIFAAGLVLLAAMVVNTAGAGLSVAQACTTQGCHGEPTTPVVSSGTSSQPMAACVKSASCGGGAALAFSGGAGLLFFAVVGGERVARSSPRVARRRAELVARLRAGVTSMVLRPPQTI
jgi:hypothetical protein